MSRIVAIRGKLWIRRLRGVDAVNAVAPEGVMGWCGSCRACEGAKVKLDEAGPPIPSVLAKHDRTASLHVARSPHPSSYHEGDTHDIQPAMSNATSWDFMCSCLDDLTSSLDLRKRIRLQYKGNCID